MQKFQFISLDRVLAKFYRDFRGIEIDEGDAIEWIGEALDFMKIASVSEEVVEFLKVKNHNVEIPKGLQYIVQIGKFRHYDQLVEEDCEPKVFLEELQKEVTSTMNVGGCPEVQGAVLDCNGKLPENVNLAFYRPLTSLQYSYGNWTNRTLYRAFEPVRLSENIFLKSVVCDLTGKEEVYKNCREEYTIVQDYLRFSFKEGIIAVAYLRTKIDSCTGYPMIPDDTYAINAITYYLIWKYKQREAYLHREGSLNLAKDAEIQWNSYLSKFKNKVKMPQTIDEYQNLLEEQFYMLPNQDKYYQFFGNLGTKEHSTYSDPDRRNYYGRK